MDCGGRLKYSNLYQINVWKRLDGLRSDLNLVEVSGLWLSVLALEDLLLRLSFSNGLLGLLVLLLSLDNLLLAVRWS